MKKGLLPVLTALTGVAVGAGTLGYQKVKQHEQDFKVIKKNEAILKMFNQWLIIKQEGKSIASYLEKNNFKKIAIYGMSYAGERLLDDLKGTGIEIAYAIDKNAEKMFAEVDIVTLDDTLDPVNAVIVTAVYFFDEIEEKLNDLIDCPVISLEDIVYEL